MSQTAITLAFEQWKASQAVTGESVLLNEFVFANVPGLDASKPIDRNETLPPDAQIVHRQAVSRKGVVNENAVVHSVVLGADVGDFSFNWIGLINKASNTLAMIVHAPLQQKLKTKDGQQGNVLTRSFLMEFNGAQTETGISTPAETWQIDFTARMAVMDERQRLENIDIYGAAAFFGDGYLVGKNGSQYFVTPGVGYVRGLRTLLGASQNIVVTNKPVKVWLDVAWTGTLTSAWAVESKITVTDVLADYVQNGVQHFVYAVANIDENGVITDLRPKGSLGDQQANKDFLRKDKNLSDLSDKAKARDNLELKAAATREVADNASGALIPVGYKGNFMSHANHDPIDFATYPFVVGESLFIDVRGCTNTPSFLTQDYYYIDVVCATSPAQGGRVNRPLIQFVSYTKYTQILAIREDDGTTTGWRYFRAVQFDNDNQTVSLPGAVNAVNGGIQLSQNAVTIRGSGNKHLWFHDQNGKEMGLVYASDDKVLHLRAGEGPTVNIGSDGVVKLPGPVIDASYYQTNPSGSAGWHGAGMFASQYANAAPFLIPLRYSTPKDASVYLPMIKGLSQTDYWGYGSAVSFGILRSGQGDFGSAVINIIGDSGQGVVFNFNSNGDFNVPRQIGSGGNIVAGSGLFESGGAVRVYSSNNPPPQQDLSPYATASWTIANFLQGGLRLASAGVATNGNNDNEFAYAPNGTVVTAVQQKTNYTAVQYRSLQYNIGGNWYTAWVA
ncbi:phage tail-collar fiber domain-containing protein [Enterobacter cloacae complex sp. FDA-CDC-AR_0132]|uniref:phage tail-collar fiber domain-containing protein n=1 Tax=Enterobacter cloacae complex sp. FDA-CDC-AR_0132 TaxID=2077137 RepID=UPI001F3C1063|nr:phage tail protein [Enterobacter cloacae complex sp. FDA-CDC-AR_0132]